MAHFASSNSSMFLYDLNFTGSTCFGYSSNMGVCHTESLNTTLYSDRGSGFGLGVSVGDHTDNKPADILISRIVPDSPAYRYFLSFIFIVFHCWPSKIQ